MSMTSSDNHALHPDLTDLLTRHAALADWLTYALYGSPDIQAQELLPRFLVECTEQGVPENTYPFSAQDQGLEDLQAYLQQAHQDTANQDVTQPHSAESAPIEPTTEAETPNHDVISEKNNNDVIDEHEEEDIAQISTAHIPATPANSEEGANQATGEALEPIETEEDIAQVSTAHIPATPASAANSDEELAHTVSESLENDIAQISTAHIPAALAQEEPTAPTDSSDEAVSQASVGDVSADTDDVTRLATARMPVAALVADKAEQEHPPIEKVPPDSNASEEEIDPTLTEHEEGEPTSQVAPLGRKTSTPLHRGKRPKRLRSRRQRILSWVLLVIVLVAILIPAIMLINFGVSAYTTYRNLSTQAHSAVNHLMDVKTTFSTGNSGGSHLSGLLNVSRLQRAEQDFAASNQDFRQLQKQLKGSATLQTVTTYFPQYRDEFVSAQAASQIGIDVAAIGQIATSHAAQIAPTFSGSLLAPTGKPLITQPLLNTLNTTIDQVTPLLEDIQAQSQYVSLDSLPISASEKTQVGQLFALLPQVISDIGVTRSLLSDAGWLLGVNQPRTFLVQTMDRAELRGAGGFTGQYGELTINGGRVAPFSLKDISLVEYTNTSVTQGQGAPAQYRTWWPFANWGLRDSNISADFPTTAQLAINLYKQETGDSVDGVISFTPVVIEHVLSVIGPIQVPGYNTTVNAQNLEDILHYYQLDNSGIYKQIIKQPGDTSTSQRKRFTNLLTTLLMSKVRSASADELLGIGHQVLADLKSKDLQIYFTDPATENVLVKYGYSGQLDRSTSHDGEFVVQQNLSASKASQYVQTIEHDTVTLDSNGGATHVLQLRLIYNQAGPVYGYDTYYDYLRVYVPPSSQLLSGDGFSSGTPLCGGAYGNCPVNGPYSGGELSCPAGQYQPGASPPTLTEPDGGTWQPLQTLTGPTNTTSDEPDRAMYGGWVIVPKNCTMNVTLSWYVPPMSGQHYSLLVQRQSGVFPELDLSILPSAADCAQLGSAGLHVDTTLTKDTSFSLPAYHPSTSTAGKSCYPHLGV